MAKSTVVQIQSDLSGETVGESEAVEVVVLSHPDIKRPVKLHAAPDEVAGLRTTDKPLVRLRVDGQEITVELAKFNKAFAKGVDPKAALNGAELISEPSGGTRANRGRTKSNPAEPAAMREWTRANSYEVADRGRISQEIQDAYASR